MVVLPVDQDDGHGRTTETFGDVESREAAAEDDDTGLRRSGLIGTVHRLLHFTFPTDRLSLQSAASSSIVR